MNGLGGEAAGRVGAGKAPEACTGFAQYTEILRNVHRLLKSICQEIELQKNYFNTNSEPRVVIPNLIVFKSQGEHENQGYAFH